MDASIRASSLNSNIAGAPANFTNVTPFTALSQRPHRLRRRHDDAQHLRCAKRQRQTIFRLSLCQFGAIVGKTTNGRQLKPANAWRVTDEAWLRCQGLITVRQIQKPNVSATFPKCWSHNQPERTKRLLLCTVQADSSESILEVWNNMKTHVAAGDILGAITYFSFTSTDDYRDMFLGTGTSSTTATINQTGNITPVFIYDDTAEYYFEEVVDGKTITFPVEFLKESGAWRILEF